MSVWTGFKTILGQELTVAEKSNTENNASLCAAEYGDGVNWSRGLAKRWSETRYDLAESCSAEIVQPRWQNPIAADITIQPNPSYGHITFGGLDLKAEYQFDLLTTRGQLIGSNIKLTAETTDLSYLEEGVYFIRLTNLSSRVKTTIKTVIIK